MNTHQVPALEPHHTEPRHPRPDPAKSPTALRGATSAFLPKATIPIVSVSPVSAGARVAALAAGTRTQAPASSKLLERTDGQKEPSPPRGRQLHSVPPTTLSNGGATASTSTPSQPSRPFLQPHSPSTIAAQHAAAQSRSPNRSPSPNPQSATVSISSQPKKDISSQDANALLRATASLSAHAAKEQVKVEPAPSVKDRTRLFEKSPSHVAQNVQQVQINIMQHETLQQTTQRTLSEPGRESARSLPNMLLSDESFANSTTRLQLPRPSLSRGSSAESTSTTRTMPYAEIDSARTSPQRERPANPPRTVTQMPVQAKAQYQTKHYDDRKSSLTVNELADAMVASSLASSRANSPSKKNILPASRRRSRSFPAPLEKYSPSIIERRHKPTKPPRPMKQTLRKPTSSDEEVELIKRGRRHWMRKHPNMHSEGARKRWRDKVTERERKRYEGVFAANRGLLIGAGHFEPTPSALSDNLAEGNQVINVVVRDLWERSRLPREVLKEVYDLVCPEEAHALSREQFVVGLWLIDQRLKGRKLPVRVSASVWASVRHSQGLKVKRRFG